MSCWGCQRTCSSGSTMRCTASSQVCRVLAWTRTNWPGNILSAASPERAMVPLPGEMGIRGSTNSLLVSTGSKGALVDRTRSTGGRPVALVTPTRSGDRASATHASPRRNRVGKGERKYGQRRGRGCWHVLREDVGRSRYGIESHWSPLHAPATTEIAPERLSKCSLCKRSGQLSDEFFNDKGQSSRDPV